VTLWTTTGAKQSPIICQQHQASALAILENGSNDDNDNTIVDLMLFDSCHHGDGGNATAR
jgi:hypothetical protein